MFYTNEEYVNCTWKENGTVEIGHLFHKFEKDKPVHTKRTAGYKGSSKNLSVRNWLRQLDEFYYRVKDRIYDNTRCIFITLTTKQIIDPKLLVKKFGAFIKILKKYYDKIEYARVVEFNENEKRCHIHCVLQFTDRPIIYKKMFEKYWKLGHCEISNLKKDCIDISTIPLIDDVVNVLQYMSKHSNNDIFKYKKSYGGVKLRYKSRFTLFPRNFRVCAISRNFGTIVQLKSISYTMPVSTAEKIIQNWEFNSKPHNKHHKTNKSLRIQGHYYNDNFFIDKVDIRNIQKEEIEKYLS